MRLKTPESGVLRACLDLLAAERIWFERRNTGAVKVDNRFVQYGTKGTADILATIKPIPCDGCHNGPQILWIECKSDTGKQSKAQKSFQATVEAAGHHYIVVRSSDELLKWLRARG